MADIVLKDRNGNDIVYPGVTSIKLNTVDGGAQSFNACDEVEKTIDLDFSAGDMEVSADEGTLLSKVTIEKPETLLPKNVRNGVEVAGVTGEFIGDTEEVTVELALADGDQTVSPSADGKVISGVTITKPANLVPENIAKDVDIAGVVGTLESGGGGGSGDLILHEPEWIDDVCFWDYDGTLLRNISVAQAHSLSELPTPPAHDGLTFLGWNYTLEQVNACEYPIDVGAMYVPSDGKTHLHLSVTKASYLAVPMNFVQTVANGVSIDWGDGSAAETVSGTGVVQVTHTYSAIGEYDVVITVADGCTMTLGGGTYKLSFIGNNTSTYRRYLTELYIGYNVEINTYGVYANSYMTTLTMPNTITTLPQYGTASLGYLRQFTIPNSVTALASDAVNSVGSATAIPPGAISIPENISVEASSVTSGFFNRLSIPKTITVIPNRFGGFFYYGKRLFMSNKVTAIGDYVLSGWHKLRKVDLPECLTSLGNNNMYDCYGLTEFKIPKSLTAIGDYFGYSAFSLRELFIPASVATVGSNFFYSDHGMQRIVIEGTTTFSASISKYSQLQEIIYLSETPPSELVVNATGLDSWCPDSAYDTYLAKVGTSYSRLHKLSEYRGVLPDYVQQKGM